MTDELDKKDMEQINQFTRDRVGISTLERYTGSKVEDFQPYILLTNFYKYVKNFSETLEEPIHHGSAMVVCHSKNNGITIINYSVGSPMAALVIELLSFIKPKATLMLGMCGGLRPEYEVGNYFVPVAAIREEGTSDAYMPKQCPSLSSFLIQRYVCEELEKRKLTYSNGVIHTTNVRFWEFNEDFKKTLAIERAQAIDMECATLFTVGFARYVPVGALMLISDLPLKPGGVKTASSAAEVFKQHTVFHSEMGISVLKAMQADEKEQGFDYHF
ncbi:MAG: AMP nucleosidase [Gammaproteobacteria bacterium]|nr:AMP nucleosidase [Gammaproteobacteria bacterium]